jgi:hypothetical protein
MSINGVTSTSGFNMFFALSWKPESRKLLQSLIRVSETTTRSWRTMAGSWPRRNWGLESVPTARLSHLSAEERRAYLLLDNKFALNAGWDARPCSHVDFDVGLSGFSLAEVDFALDRASEGSPDDTGSAGDDDAIPEPPVMGATRPQDAPWPAPAALRQYAGAVALRYVAGD